MTDRVVPVIHARGSASRLDALSDLVSFVARPRALATTLDELPARIASILRAHVCSIYLLEGDDLVMRGNVGFPREALGEVRLAIGEGLTGLCIEVLRPVSVEVAHAHARYRNFPELDENKFPIFLAVPVPGAKGALGALVVQRRQGAAFDPGEIELAVALTMPIAAAIERARLADAGDSERRSTGGGTRRMTLSGRSIVPGRSVGALHAMRRPAAVGRRTGRVSAAQARERLTHAIELSQKRLKDLSRSVVYVGGDVAVLEIYRTIVEDGRLREIAFESIDRGEPISRALGRVATEAARTASLVGDSYGVRRARAISEICEALVMASEGDRRAEIPKGAVVTGDQISIFDLLVTARSLPSGVVLTQPLHDDEARTLLRILGVPSVADCTGLYHWASDGDVVLVDGDHGLVRLNPSRAEISLVRTQQRRPRGETAHGETDAPGSVDSRPRA